MNNRIRKLLAGLLSFAMLITIPCVNVSATNNLSADSDVFFNTSQSAQRIYEGAKLIPYSEAVSSQFDFQNGLTIIYGNNITLTAISFDDNTKEIVSEIEASSKGNTASLEQKNEDIETYNNTYMVLCMKQDDRVDIEYVSVTYEANVNIEKVETFIAAELTEAAIDARAKAFACEQVQNSTSAYNAIITDNQRSGSTTQVVVNVRDTNYYIANYTTNTGSIYPLMIYKKNITYQAMLVGNDLDDDLYVIMAFVYVTPGNDISSFTAAEYASMSASEIYNDTYSNAIAVKGIKTEFFNLNPNKDYFIDMSPKKSINNVNEETISISLGYPASVSLSFDVVTNTASKINMTTSFDAAGTCTVKFEAFKRFLSFTNPCLSTEQFTYTAGVYMCSGGNVLSTKVGTSVLYYFQNAGADSAIWAGSARTLTYTNN